MKVDQQVQLKQLLAIMGNITGNRNDSNWTNFASGIGGVQDKNEQTDFVIGSLVPLQTFESMCRKDGIAKTIVKAPAKDATKNWIELTEDTDGKILRQLKKLKTKQAFTQLLTHARKFGGGAILLQTKNGGELKEPLKLTGSATKITGLKNFSRADFDILESDINDDPKSEFYEDVEIFKLKKRRGDTVEIHRSRLLILKGEKLDRVETLADPIEEEFWGTSVLEAAMDALGYYGVAMKAISTMMQEATIGKFIMGGLKELLDAMGDNDAETSQEAWARFQARIKAMVITKSVINAILFDAEAGEDFKRDSFNFAGIPDIVALFQMQLAGMNEIPITKLFGRSPAGENSTGESDAKNYDNLCIGLQEDIEPLVQQLVDMITGTEDKYVVTFKHPTPPTQKEHLEMKKLQAEIDKIHTVDVPALFPEEVRQSRYGNGEWSFNTEISGKGPVGEPGTEGEEEGEEATAEDVAEYLETIQGFNQSKFDEKLEEKLDEIIEALDKPEFNEISKNDRVEALKASGYFTDEQISRMTNS